MTPEVSTGVRITVGVDTHADAHVAAALDQLGRLVETQSVPTTPTGYKALLAWARSLGELERFGIEGTGSYGAGLARWLHGHGVEVVEVERPERQKRRWRGSPMRLMPKQLLGRSKLGPRPPSPRPEMDRSRCCVACR